MENRNWVHALIIFKLVLFHASMHAIRAFLEQNAPANQKTSPFKCVGRYKTNVNSIVMKKMIRSM